MCHLICMICVIYGRNLKLRHIVNQIKVAPDVKHWARVALDRMLEIQ